MRYRPFHSAGLSISAVTLDLPHGLSAATAHAMVEAALESGVNGLCVSADDPTSLAVVSEAVARVGRGLLVLLIRLEIGEGLAASARAALQACGVGLFDAAVVEIDAASELTPTVRAELEALRGQALARRVAVAVRTEEAGVAALEAFRFDVLAFRFNVTSGWPERNLLRRAASLGMTVLGFDPHPEGFGLEAGQESPRGLARLLVGRRRGAPRGAHTFLDQTPGWTAEEITLAFALTEPRLASVLVRTDRTELLHRLAAVPDKELPPNVAAQIEMARFSAPPGRKIA